MTTAPTTPAVANRRPGSSRYDVVVVGGRVAGAATAMLLARCGRRVLLVDREQRGADTVSTHTILRTGVLQLRRWGLLDRIVAAGTPPVTRVTLGFGTEFVPIDLGDSHGVDALYAPRRTLLDAVLVAAAEDAGAEYLPRTRMIDLVTDPNHRVRGIVVDTGSVRTTVETRFVVGADGVCSRVARCVAAPRRHTHRPTNSVRYAYYSGVATDGVHFQFTPGATAGLIPTDGGNTCVYVGWPSVTAPAGRSDPEDTFKEQLRRSDPALAATVGEGKRVSGFRGTRGLPGFLRRASGPGWALVGDSGHTKDPVSAHGISAALRDAELCARAIDRSLTTPHDESAAMGRYGHLRDRLAVPLLESSAELAAYTWDASRASALMRSISRSVRDECDLLVSLPSWTATGDRRVPATR